MSFVTIYCSCAFIDLNVQWLRYKVHNESYDRRGSWQSEGEGNHKKWKIVNDFHFIISSEIENDNRALLDKRKNGKTYEIEKNSSNCRFSFEVNVCLKH